MIKIGDFFGEGYPFVDGIINGSTNGHKVIKSFKQDCISCKEPSIFNYIRTDPSTGAHGSFDIYSCGYCGQEIAEQGRYSEQNKN